MPTKREKLLEQARRQKWGWKSSEIRKLYLAFGFVQIDTGGDTKFKHPDHPELCAYVTRSSGNIAPGYAHEAVKKIDELLKLEQEEADNG